MEAIVFKENYRVYYSHTDAGGVVYHSRYLDFCEQCRTDYLRSKNISQTDLLKNQDILFVVYKAKIEYKASAKLDDLLTVTIEKLELKQPKILFLQKIYNQNNQLLIICEIEIITINSEHKLYRKISENITNLLKININ